MENKTGKYFKYAIGEIALVVIGILIALQINIWNENRKIKKIEQELLKDLKVEINTSKTELQQTIASHTTNLEATIQLETLVLDPKKRKTVADKTWDRLIREMDYNMTFDPKLGIVKSIITSGKLDYISNKKLRYQLSSLTDIIVDTNESTNEIERNRPLLLWTVINKYKERQADNSVRYNYRKLFDNSAYIWWFGWLTSVRKDGLQEEEQLLLTLEEMISTIDAEIKR